MSSDEDNFPKRKKNSSSEELPEINKACKNNQAKSAYKSDDDFIETTEGFR